MTQPDEIDTMFPPLIEPVTIDPATGEVLPRPQQFDNKVSALLAEYENIVSLVELIRADKADAIAAVMPQEVQTEIEAIEFEFASKLKAGETRMEAIKKSVAEACKLFGSTVSGEMYQVQYVKPSWGIKDIEGLLAYAVGHPEVMLYLEKSKPSARVVVKKGAK